MALNLPELKGNKKTYLVVGGAASVYVAYRWYSARGTAATPTDTTLDTGSVTDATGGAYGPGNIQYGGADITVPSEVPQTNAEWTAKAVQALVNQGWDGMTVQAALGRFLTDQTLTTDQETIVRAAIASAGNPPSGVHTIIKTPSSPSAPPASPASWSSAPVTGIRVNTTHPTNTILQWNSKPGAFSYDVQVNGPRHATASRVYGPSYRATGLRKSTTYTARVRAQTATGRGSDWSAPFSFATSAK